MKIVNLTPHTLNLHGDGGVATVPPSGVVARVTTSSNQLYTVDMDGVSVAVKSTKFGELVDLPVAQEGVLYVTSLIVAQAAQRQDVVSPGTLLRGADGQPSGADGLSAHV